MRIFLSEHFNKQLKTYLRRFKNLKEDLMKCLKEFNKEQAIHLGKNNYKIRLRSSDLGKGKSGGFRLIVHIIQIDQAILPISIFFKSDIKTMSLQEINEHLMIVRMELNFD